MNSYALSCNLMGCVFLVGWYLGLFCFFYVTYLNAILFCYHFLAVPHIRGNLTDSLFLCHTFEAWKLAALKYNPEH